MAGHYFISGRSGLWRAFGGGIQNLIFRNNCRIMPDTGHSEYDVTGYMATEFFYKANPGSYIELLDSRFEYAVATYSEEINGTYIYTYSYEKRRSINLEMRDTLESALKKGIIHLLHKMRLM